MTTAQLAVPQLPISQRGLRHGEIQMDQASVEVIHRHPAWNVLPLFEGHEVAMGWGERQCMDVCLSVTLMWTDPGAPFAGNTAQPN